MENLHLTSQPQIESISPTPKHPAYQVEVEDNFWTVEFAETSVTLGDFTYNPHKIIPWVVRKVEKDSLKVVLFGVTFNTAKSRKWNLYPEQPNQIHIFWNLNEAKIACNNHNKHIGTQAMQQVQKLFEAHLYNESKSAVQSTQKVNEPTDSDAV